MMLAIVFSGITADFTMLLPIKAKTKQLLAMGVYNGISLMSSVYIANYVTCSALYRILNFEAILLAFLISSITGTLGGYAGIKAYERMRNKVDLM